ncbi:MAG: hypothetical protein P0Y58_18190 [Candidatus Pseudomonas phytovorans]|uniref:Uncharacterized protein n=1 Tax=Candidatus Pseudomonas phytovorans TaxID=3121377 RepID=A0AAJ6BBQ9_9PSED|nr:hypothetical protein [Pseudomonas sp.]WEK28836.1 MAG: hypothetical protein P0Y58_18190 [Pseudomonas sp.]
MECALRIHGRRIDGNLLNIRSQSLRTTTDAEHSQAASEVLACLAHGLREVVEPSGYSVGVRAMKRSAGYRRMHLPQLSLPHADE